MGGLPGGDLGGDKGGLLGGERGGLPGGDFIGLFNGDRGLSSGIEAPDASEDLLPVRDDFGPIDFAVELADAGREPLLNILLSDGFEPKLKPLVLDPKL